MHNHKNEDDMCPACQWTDTIERLWDSDESFAKLNALSMSESLCTELAMNIITLETAAKGMGLESPTCANQFVQLIAMIREQASATGKPPFEKP